MDSSQNWLGFSLSNHHMPSDSSQFCLFEAFNTTNSGVGDKGEDGAGSTDLSILTGAGGPKLEDFLGGCGNNSSTGAADVSQFSGETPTSLCTSNEIYDSDLKTIAAGFLRGLSEQTDTPKQLAVAPPEPVAKKAVDTFGQRTSIYRGVTRHRWTGRYEAHLWDNSCRREGQNRKGRQVYLGGYDKEEKAARAYDLAALKYWGPTTTTNFPVTNYRKELEDMKNMTRQEFVASLRRKSSGFSRGASIYRGVTRHHQHGRWQARIGRVAGNKDLYLGTFSTQEEAAEAYDIAAIKFRGLNAVTNFDMSRYDVKSIACSSLPVGGVTGKSKTTSDQLSSNNKTIDKADRSSINATTTSALSFGSQPATSTLNFALPIKQDPIDYWSILRYQNKSSSLTGAKNPTSSVLSTLYQLSSTTSCSVQPFDCSHISAVTETTESGNGLFNSSSYFHPQSNATSSFASPIALNSGNNGSSESGFGNWIAPSLHTFQSAKPNLSAFQTPIFGME